MKNGGAGAIVAGVIVALVIIYILVNRVFLS